MKKNLRLSIVAALGAAASLAFTSCAYDPYSSTSIGGSYSTGGYGDGYGYGGSSFSTSVFVGTGDPRWGYDPYTYSYYDYGRRSYYDPYLHGYYPVGYRPPIVYGVPHPYGWRPGSGYCPPPLSVRNVTVVNYRDRERAYRNTDYGWSRQVRQQSSGGGGGRIQGERPSQQYRNTTYDRSSSRPSTRDSSPRQSQIINQREETRPRTTYSRNQDTSRNPYTTSDRRYTSSETRYSAPQRNYSSQVNPYNKQQSSGARTQARQEQRPQLGVPRTTSRTQPAPSPRVREERAPQREKSRTDEENGRIQGYR